MVQSTFTKQKRALVKAMSWIDKIRAHEVRHITYSAEEQALQEERESYVDYSPEEVVKKITEIIGNVVSEHGARQKSNSRNKGHFAWSGIEAELTVPQLRALQSAHTVFNELVCKLPRRNPRLIPNTTLDGRPAFAHMRKKHEETQSKYVPYEEDHTTRVRTYEEKYQVTTHFTQKIEIDYGLEAATLNTLEEMVEDFGTAIQVAIDQANAKGRENDPLIDQIIRDINQTFVAKLPTAE
ncbi:MAG: hypothetical protein HQM14_19465 [SAR324 cluster bacterium]|nr:hypothetical protein [SAR324 cluster bacterium]